jgi:tetratricopeptide (TPR) repeat protein
MQSHFYVLLLCFPLIIACQSNPNYKASQILPRQNLYLDNEFSSKTFLRIETEQEIFALDDEMRVMVQEKLTHNFTAYQKAKILLKHLFNDENIALSYQGNANVTARQAYHNKVANCISLTIMAYALAKEAGMNVSFRDVEIPEYWVRNGQYNLLTGHVNLLVKENTEVRRRLVWGEKEMRIDFDPFVAKKTFPSRNITKQTLLAMFYNNKGAEEMVNDNYPLAYRYLKKATQTDNQFTSAWGNLGILYKLNDHNEMAEHTYRHAIRLKSNNLTSLGNLALLLNKQGRINEACNCS